MIYGIGPCREWCSLHRDVMVDMKKFVSDWNSVKHLITSIKHLEVRGEGYIDNVTISEHCHEGLFTLFRMRKYFLYQDVLEMKIFHAQFKLCFHCFTLCEQIFH